MQRFCRSFLTYENAVVLILGLTFGILFFDRNAINVLMPFIVKDMHLDNTQVGLVGSALALSWSITNFAGGRASDLLGRRKIYLIVTILAFSACSFWSGLATSFIMLVTTRLVMGVAEGPVPPLVISILVRSSSPHRVGANNGIVQIMFNTLFGNVLAPLVLVPLALAFNWRVSFFLAGVPGLVLAFVIFKVIREKPVAKRDETAAVAPELGLRMGLVAIIRQRNIWLSMILTTLAFSYIVPGSIFLPLYYVQVLHFPPQTMAYLMSVVGICGVTTGGLVPAISDRIGRKPTVAFFSLLGVVAPLANLYMYGSFWGLCALSFIGWSFGSVVSLVVATIPCEALPPHYHGTAVGLAAGAGELVGSFVAPTVAGWIADHTSLAAPLFLQMGCAIAAALLALLLIETAPAVLGKRVAVAA